MYIYIHIYIYIYMYIFVNSIVKLIFRLNFDENVLHIMKNISDKFHQKIQSENVSNNPICNNGL